MVISRTRSEGLILWDHSLVQMVEMASLVAKPSTKGNNGLPRIGFSRPMRSKQAAWRKSTA